MGRRRVPAAPPDGEMSQAAAWPSAGSSPGSASKRGRRRLPRPSSGDGRFRSGLVRSVAWSLWSVVWSFWSGLVRTAGDRVTGRDVAGVGGQVGDGLLDAGQLVADAGQELQVARGFGARQGLYRSVRQVFRPSPSVIACS